MNIIAKILLILPLMGAFSVGCAVEAATPACSNPARLEGHRDPKAPGVFIGFKPGVDPNWIPSIGASRTLNIWSSMQ
jgi:hypothetical protein